MDFKVIKLIDFYNELNNESQISREDFSRDILSKFKCEKNLDEDKFIHEIVFKHEDSKKSVTYLIIKDTEILGYFTLAMQMIELKNVSKSKIKSVTSGSTPQINDDNIEIYSSYLIGHFSKNDNNKIKYFGRVMMDEVFRVLNDAQKLVGGSIAYLDCVDELVSCYKTYNFKMLKESVESILEDGTKQKSFNKMYCKIPLINN